MSKLGINTGTFPNDNTGDSILVGATKINSNFDEIYSYFGDGTSLNILNDINQLWTNTSVGISTTKNVGIGTTNPISKLTVIGDVSISGVTTTTKLNIGTSGTIFTSTSEGFIGIKTTSPRFPLEVGAIGTSNTSLHVNGNARVTGILSIGQGTITLDGSLNKINVGSGVTIDGSSNFIAVNTVKFANNNSLTTNAEGKLKIGGNSVEGRLEGVYNVKDYGAIGDGEYNDTTAFNNAIAAAGDYGTVYAPPGNYKVNGILLNRINQNINIDGTLIIDFNSVGLIFDRSTIGSSTQNCNVFVKEIKHYGQSPAQRPTDNSIGVSFRNGSFNTVRFGRIGFLHYAFKIEPASISPQGLTSDNRISGNLIEWCSYGIHSVGGSTVDKHTEHTMVEVNFIAHYRYGIYKTNSIGSQKFWYVNTAFDAFPGENPDYVADIYDDYIQANDENLNACWYQTYFSTDNNAYQGNAFTDGRNCYLFDVTRRKANFGNTLKFDTYLGTLEFRGPTGSLGASGPILTSADGTRYRLVVSNAGTLTTTQVV